MKIYTKKGDTGETSLIGGKRVPKHHVQIEAYGTVDELNSFVGLVRDWAPDQKTKDFLVWSQDRLFTMGSLLAEVEGGSKMKLPQLKEDDIVAIEREIDRLEEDLPEMRHFILPGGHQAVSSAHMARSVCRRAERTVLRMNETHQVQTLTFQFLNRFSDYLFVLSRWLAKELDADEMPWLPEKD
ncbi:cob(I)yrinic acid a,c-diamide adenosyltransferase [Halocola ammonii]